MTHWNNPKCLMSNLYQQIICLLNKSLFVEVVRWGSLVHIWYLLFCRVVACDRIAMCQSLCPRHCPLPAPCSLGVPGHAKTAAHRCLAAPHSATRRIFPLALPSPEMCPTFTSLTSQRSPLRHQYWVGALCSLQQHSWHVAYFFLRSLLPFCILLYKNCPRRIPRKKERPWTSWHMTDFIWLDFQSQKN